MSLGGRVGNAVAGEGLLEGLLEHLRSDLAAWIERENRAGRRPGDDERRDRATGVIREWMLSLAQQRLVAGMPMLDAAAEEDLVRTALAYAFGAGPWERFLNDPDLTDIHINGCDEVWLVCHQHRQGRYGLNKGGT